MTTPNPFESSTEEDTEIIDFGSPEPDNPFDGGPSLFPTDTTTSHQSVSQQHSSQKEYIKKYNIVDLYWLVNQKLFNSEKLNKDEVALLIIGYNADFNNLRIAFHDVSAKTFNETSILKHETKQITTVNIFSETAQKILFNVHTKKFKDEFSNFERIFTASSGNNDWKPNPTQIEMNIPNNIILKTKFNNNIYSFTFLDWQIQAFLNAMKFMTNGDAWKASLNI